MSAPVPLVVGIVLYRNQRNELERLLASLESARRAGPRFRLVWRDNSGDPAAAEAWAGLGIDASGGDNVGFGRGHNELMAEAFADDATRWYLCLNPDAVVHPDMFQELVAQVGRMNRPGLVEPLQFPDEHPKHYDPVSGATSWCSGCALMVTRELYETIGGYDDRIFLYCEDVDLSWRARAAGFTIATAPRALVHHFTGDRPPAGRTRIEMVRAGAYVGRKFGSKEFERACAEEFKTLTGESLVVPEVEVPTPQLKAVADFGSSFHFARARW